jgi:general secretion pathway protein D
MQRISSVSAIFFIVVFCLGLGISWLVPRDLAAASSRVAGAQALPAKKPAQTVQKATGGSGKRFVTIDFNDVDINLFIKYISELSGKNFVVDRSVKGKVTIISPTRISEDDAYRVFESVLEVHGYTTVPSGSIIKIVPAVQARSKSIATIMQGEQGVSTEDKVVTRIIPLAYSDPNELKKILAPLVSKTSVVIAHPQSGMLIITDVLSNINRLLDIIQVVDVPSVGEELEIIPLEHASASKVGKSISQLFLRSAKKGAKSATIKIIPYERTNSLIVFAPRTQINKIRELLKKLDSKVPRGGGKIHVYYLQHANAEELVKVLTNLPAKQSNAKGKSKLPPLSNDLKITADAETNALIITAPREEYLVLEDVIKKLDIPRRMVYLEALIMEVHVNKDFKVGVEWGGGGTFADDTGKLISGFSGTEAQPYSVLKGISQQPPALPAGFALGVLKQGVEIGGVYFPDLGAVVSAFKNDSDINIVATPQVLTTDNKKASIVVGENVPYITSKNTTGAGTGQDYTNYEYKDVATTLEITPQINQADLLRLEINVEVIKLKDANDFRPTTFKRTANTTVVVHNEETVVIGGMIGQDTATAEYKVPLLGDIPVLGWLFKSHGEREEKTNLFIFITPHIVESSPELAALYYKKRDVMEYVQRGSSKIPDHFFHAKENPAHATALADMGFAKLQKGEYDKAEAYFNQALKINPDNPYALINLGVIYEHQGNREKAAEKYRQVLNLAGQEVAEGEEGPAVEQALQNAARENLRHLEEQE